MPERFALSCLFFFVFALSVDSLRTEDFAESTGAKVPGDKGNLWVCTRKYEFTQKRFTNQFCLTNLKETLTAVDAAGPKTDAKIRLGVNMKSCVAKSKPHTLKVCRYKGEPGERRIHYAERKRVPKRCFYPEGTVKVRSPNGKESTEPVALLESAVSGRVCNRIKTLWSIAEQAKFTPVPKNVVVETNDEPVKKHEHVDAPAAENVDDIADNPGGEDGDNADGEDPSDAQDVTELANDVEDGDEAGEDEDIEDGDEGDEEEDEVQPGDGDEAPSSADDASTEGGEGEREDFRKIELHHVTPEESNQAQKRVSAEQDPVDMQFNSIMKLWRERDQKNNGQ